MKKLLSLMVVLALTVCMMPAPTMAFAKDPVVSPEKENTEVEDPDPTSPQTGGLSVGVFAVGAALSGGVAVTAIKKATSKEENN